jgi:hypothetical protein
MIALQHRVCTASRCVKLRSRTPESALCGRFTQKGKLGVVPLPRRTAQLSTRPRLDLLSSRFASLCPDLTIFSRLTTTRRLI